MHMIKKKSLSVSHSNKKKQNKNYCTCIGHKYDDEENAIGGFNKMHS